MDEEWVEEEILVYLDYGQFIPGDEITDPDLQFKVIGLDKTTVYSEVNGKVFTGTIADTKGTNLFFAEDTNRTKSENVFERLPETVYTLQASCNKMVTMKRTCVEAKEGVHDAAGSQNDPPSESGIRQKFTVEQTYQEALNKLLKPGTFPPRTVTDCLDNKLKIQRELELDLELECENG